jgi:hypothetical protein
MKPYPYTLFTIETSPSAMKDSKVNHHPKEAWPCVLEDMSRDFEDYPMVLELWLRREKSGSNDTVLLWKRP